MWAIEDEELLLEVVFSEELACSNELINSEELMTLVGLINSLVSL